PYRSPRDLEVPRPRALAAGLEERRRRFADLVEEAARRYGLDRCLLDALIMAESAYRPRAVSSKGALGLMQLMPETARRYGVSDPFDPRQNIQGGARFLKDLLAAFGGDVRLAIAAYNAGEEAVRRYSGIPPYPETRRHVAKVMALYRRAWALVKN
ncbi:MAG: lytic transglycosylase domain-containing protein, partial [Gammaproteobacteria bacterium]